MEKFTSFGEAKFKIMKSKQKMRGKGFFKEIYASFL